MTTSSCWIRGYNSTPSPTVQSTPVNRTGRARQRCFWLLAFISRPQVRNIHLPGRMILPGSLIPSDKYFLKNLTFVVRNPLVWLRHHSSQSNSLRGSRHDFPSGRPGRTLLFSCCSSPWPRKEFDWNGNVATRRGAERTFGPRGKKFVWALWSVVPQKHMISKKRS